MNFLDCTPHVNTYQLQGVFKSFLEHEMSIRRIESVFNVNFQDYVFFDLGLSIRQRKTREANPALVLVPTLTCRLPYLA